jgi:hypothetical protein
VNFKTSEQIKDSGSKEAYSSNELVMITDTSVPHTDKLGYKHIGAFPYGANLVLTKGGQMRDATNFIDVIDHGVEGLLGANGVTDEISLPGVSSESNQGVQGSTISTSYEDDLQEKTISEYKDNLDKVYSASKDIKQQQNDQANPNLYNSSREVTGLVSLNEVDAAAKVLIDVSMVD